MTNELWVRLRKLLRRRTPSREIERIVSSFRADAPRDQNGFGRKRERLDMCRGWVLEDVEDEADRPGAGPARGRSKRVGTKTR